MNKHYERLLQKLNVVKWELKGRNDPTLNLCIQYLKDAIVEAGKLNYSLEVYDKQYGDNDDADCWCD